jgi:uncharacterized repeat protein (TIGR03803 family)
MKHSILGQTLALTILFVLGTINYAQAQGFSVIYTFGDHSGDPLNPQSVGVIAQGRDGNLYTTTPHGGSTGSRGTAFRITPGGKVTVLDSFDLSHIIFSGLTLGTDGNFYGSTYGGGLFGTVFKITPQGKLTLLHNFTGHKDGAHPFPPPVQGADGNFYGTTSSRGTKNGGTAYKITPSGKLTTIFEFDGKNGYPLPASPLVQGTDGNFYGTTQQGGDASNDGVVFRLTPSGKFTVLHPFDSTDGSHPDSALVQASDSNFYGTTKAGGNFNLGVAFKITPEGGLTVLHHFAAKDGGVPWGLVQATDGNLYGVTQESGKDGYGTIYKLTLNGKFSVIHTFSLVTGAYPSVALIQHTNGILYGDTYQGGAHDSGVFFKLKIGAAPFVSLLPILGKVGATIEFLGQGFTGTTGVSFNGTAATFNVVSSTYLTAVVPVGATTGYVTVTTPGGTVTSNRIFRVTP